MQKIFVLAEHFGNTFESVRSGVAYPMFRFCCLIQAAFLTTAFKGFQFQVSNSLILEAGVSAIRERASVNQAYRSTPLSLAVLMSVVIKAARSAAPRSEGARRRSMFYVRGRSCAVLIRPHY